MGTCLELEPHAQLLRQSPLTLQRLTELALAPPPNPQTRDAAPLHVCVLRAAAQLPRLRTLALDGNPMCWTCGCAVAEVCLVNRHASRPPCRAVAGVGRQAVAD